jgi:dihydroorotate dehydrogenase (NAD+) catalytic subunit
MLNAIGLANPGLDVVATEQLPWLAARLRRARVLVNVAGATVADYERVLERLSDTAGVTAFEINASCPNTSAGGLEFGSTVEGLTELVRRCRRRTTKPLVIKLSPILADLPALARSRSRNADAVSLVNTLPGRSPTGSAIGSGN